MTQVDFTTIDTEPVRECIVCESAPIGAGNEYCSPQCAGFDEMRCDICNTFTFTPMAHRKEHHPETITITHQEPSETDLGEEPDTGVNTAAVEDADPSRGPHCVECGRDVSKQYARVFGDGNAVNGCAECRSRTERY